MPTRSALAAAIDALGAQWTLLVDTFAALTPEQFDRPSVLDGWRVSELAAHLARGAASMTDLRAAPAGSPPMTLAAYVSRYAGSAGEIAADARDRAATETPAQLVATMRADCSVQVAGFARDAVPPGAERAVLSAPRGPLRMVDVVLTRLVEVVTHADDLVRSLAQPDRAELVDRTGLVDRAGLRIVCRALADALADRAPGHTVELRVPPYAAVQCIEGPRHTRGTPPNVVETDPLTWLRLATGRVRWAEVAGTPALSASGERADLSAVLPLLGSGEDGRL